MSFVRILGVRIDALSPHELRKQVESFFERGGFHLITTPNPEFLLAAHRDPEFKSLLNAAELSLPDGMGLLFAARLRGAFIPQRWTGVDFIWVLSEIAQERNQSLFLYGGFGDVPQRSALALRQRFPNLKIVGTENGMSADGSSLSELEILARIQKKSPDILLVALGAGRGEQGKQERWIREHQHLLPSVKIAMGVGGAFDYLSGRVRRAPKWMQNIGLEWLFRLILQPWRITRIFRATIIFPILVLCSSEHESSHS